MRCLFLLLSTVVACSVQAFVSPYLPRYGLVGGATSALFAKATLTDETTWRLRFALNGIPTELGKKVDELFVVEARFLEEEGYEPPQGDFRQVFLEATRDENSSRLKIVKSAWQLSEDPNDRKDGLWIWGLLKEPQYPFLLLQLETDKVPIPGETEDSIKPLKLFAQISHTRSTETGEVTLKGDTLNVRDIEAIKADPFGGATVDIFEERSVGQLRIEPIDTKAAV